MKGTKKLTKESLRIKDTDSMKVYIFKSFLERFMEDNVFSSAAALSYYLIFSFFPFVLFLNSILGLLGSGINEDSIIFSLLPEEVSDLLTAYLAQLTVTNNIPFLIGGLLSAMYLMTRAVNSMNNSLNTAYRVAKRRPILTSYALSAIFSLGLFLIVIIGAGFSIASTDIIVFISRFIQMPQFLISFWGLIRWLIMICIYFFILAALYYFMPNIKIRFFSVFPGTIFAGTGMIVSSLILFFMAKNVFRYSVVYGSLTAIIILMLWFYVVSLVIISGGILNCILFRAKKRNLSGKKLRGNDKIQ